MAGIYIHIPFCVRRCQYCDFFSTTLLTERSRYVDALLAEWQDMAHCLTEPVQTVYIGGGTPSLLETTDLQRLLQALPVEQAIEVTLEANPGDITHEKAAAWQAMGINRLSIGVQSLHDERLRLIGRRHTAQQALNAIDTAQHAGFENLSVDIMYGLPEETVREVQEDIETLIALGVPHLSTYCLTYEAGTPLYRLREQGVVRETDEETENAMYDRIVTTLTTHADYIHYEVSNFALPDFQSRHNSNYWNDTPYLGLGAGAHSYDGKHRWANPPDLEAFLQGVATHSLHRETETLTPEQHRIEHIMLGLRTAQGADLKDIDSRKIESYLQQGLLHIHNNRVAATLQGYHILNRITEDLI